jgi:hypothetical protein
VNNESDFESQEIDRDFYESGDDQMGIPADQAIDNNMLN